jgi:glycosyltransferase involved in cell wall biosynthesis
VLEAFAFGKPLVTSSTGATAEVAGGAAVLVDPYDVDSIAEGLRAVLLDDDIRARLADLGPRRAAEFSWKRCAAETYQALVQATDRKQ